jgi:hypothetical protein
LSGKNSKEGETVKKIIYAAPSALLAAVVLDLGGIPIKFDVVSFSRAGAALDCFTPGAAAAAGVELPEGHPKIDMHGTGTKSAPKIDVSKIVKPKGGKTVEEIYQEKARLNGNRVTLRGKVVKYNGEILGKNWLHLRDGTGTEPANDLTVTTQAKVKVGDTVLVDGIVRTDRDIGAGYKYAVMIEDAKVTVE